MWRTVFVADAHPCGRASPRRKDCGGRSRFARYFLRSIALSFLLLIGTFQLAAARFRGALYELTGTTSVPNSRWEAVYAYPTYRSKQYDTNNFMDQTNYQQFVIPRGVSKVRLHCGVVLAALEPRGTAEGAVQGVITKNNLGVPGLVPYPGITPVNQASVKGVTTDDLIIRTHVLPVAPGDKFQCAIWQQRPTDEDPPRTIVSSSFSIEVLE